MKDLIEALQIFLKYENKEYPTHCSHDSLYVDIDPSMVSESDIKRLDELGFLILDEESDGFVSYRFGSC